MLVLQQYLPLAVLKRYLILIALSKVLRLLQQYLPLAVLKHNRNTFLFINIMKLVATVLTACGIETRGLTSTVAFLI